MSLDPKNAVITARKDKIYGSLSWEWWQSCALRDVALTPRWLAKVQLWKRESSTAEIESAVLLKDTNNDSFTGSPRRDFAHFKRLLAPAQQNRPFVLWGDGTDGWQESAEDAMRLWSCGVASALPRLTAAAYSQTVNWHSGQQRGES